jgi:hypothetical protein
MISLSDSQLAIVQHAARPLPVEKRDIFLQRVAAMLAQRQPFGDVAVGDVVRLALCALVHEVVGCLTWGRFARLAELFPSL